MKAVNFNFKMDQQIKCALEEFANKVGMTMSSVLNVCAINIVKNQKLPFTIETESTRTNKEWLDFINESERIRNLSMKDWDAGELKDEEINNVFAELKKERRKNV